MYMRGMADIRCMQKEITLEGAGALYERFLALKTELEEMGMFAQEYKQPIPRFYPQAGSRDCAYGSGRAGYQKYFTADVIRICRLSLYPALVQGEGAADSIVRGIRMLDRGRGRCDYRRTRRRIDRRPVGIQ